MKQKYRDLLNRHEELTSLFKQAEIYKNPEKMKTLLAELKPMEQVIHSLKELKEKTEELDALYSSLSNQQEGEYTQLVKEEITQLMAKISRLETEIENTLSPRDPLDMKNVICEIRAGTGGEEAALFAAELFRMYSRYAEKKGWRVSLISKNETDIGGFKEVIFSVEGKNIYSFLKYEAGTHRVQRVPETEKSGRVHTSTATVAILPEAEVVDLEIEPKDLRIDTFCAGGHGGQSVNTTYSAVRITHLPTGLIVSCQDERSQQQNKERALQVLRSRLFALQEKQRQEDRSKERKSQIGTGDRPEKIRTYNYPQSRVTDHRTKKSWHAIEQILDGDLDDVIATLKEKVDDC